MSTPVAWAQFETRFSVPALQSPNAIALGDFNHDGRLDLAVATSLDATRISVALGNGDGTFQPAISYASGPLPDSIAAAVFNGDGNLDLVVTDYGTSNNIGILLGNGDGTFRSPSFFTATATPTYVSVGDFNNDHKLDLLTINNPYVSVMLGNGDGTFQAPINFTPTHAPSAIGIGDFNHDGKLDLAVGEQYFTTSQVEIYLGNGDGTFQPGGSYATSVNPESIVAADFRNNGKIDLAVACNGGIGVSVLLGNGDGTFQNAVSYATPSAFWVAAADLNGDGKLDLAVANFNVGGAGHPPASEASVLLGNGDGTFQAAVNYPTGKEGTYIAVGDFNGDKMPDLAVTDPLGNDVAVLLNTGVASFSPTSPLSYGPQLLGTKSAAQTVTLKNTRATALSISSISVQGEFGLSQTCGKSVAAGASCDITVRSEPATEGNLTGTVTLHVSASSKPQVIELFGAGTVVEFSPTGLNFGSQTVGSKSQPKQVSLTNTGSSALSITAVYVEGNGIISPDFTQTNNCGSSVAAGASCTFTITFDPKRKGTRSAQLQVYDNGGGTLQIVPLVGTGD
ncbi:MAG TPA: FG-GAP-like repeat-containing protein [Candidatus Binatia bacterium]|nr:FG-GAP-like repeat-containing protein [Candidatus Binatia bacterium]